MDRLESGMRSLQVSKVTAKDLWIDSAVCDEREWIMFTYSSGSSLDQVSSHLKIYKIPALSTKSLIIYP